MSAQPHTGLATAGCTRPAGSATASHRPAELHVPAEPEYVSSLRLLAAGLGARCDLTLDDIEDVRIAVDEACALLLPHVRPREMLTARFTLRRWRLAVEVQVPVQGQPSVDRTGYAWAMLRAAVGQVGVVGGDGSLSLCLAKRREVGSW